MVNVLLITTTTLQYDGLSKVVLSMCEYARPLDVKINLLLGKGAITEFETYLVDKNINFYYLADRSKNTIQYFLKLCYLLRKEKFNVVHVHGNSATMAIEMFAAWLCGVKIRISHVHSNATNHPIIHTIMRYLLRWVTTESIACSHKAGMWLYAKNYIIIPNGIEIEKYKFNKELQIKIKKAIGCTDKKVIGHIGRFSYEKNHEFLIQIFSYMCQMDENIVLLLIGDGELVDKIKRMVQLYQLNDKVIFYGTSNDVSALLSAMDVFVMPSRREGFGIAGIEAQAAGLQCFFADTISQEIIVSHNCHFLSLNDSYQTWADNILNALKQNSERNVDLREIVFKGFDIRDLTNRLNQIWHLNEFQSEGYCND